MIVRVVPIRLNFPHRVNLQRSCGSTLILLHDRYPGKPLERQIHPTNASLHRWESWDEGRSGQLPASDRLRTRAADLRRQAPENSDIRGPLPDSFDRPARI